MKRRLWSILKALFILALGVCLTVALIHFVDIAFDGLVGDWIKSRYYIESGYPTEDGYVYETYVDWGRVRHDLFFLLIANTVIWLGGILVFSAAAKNREQKRVVNQLSAMIHRYIGEDLDAAAVFPDRYAKISAEMAEIKADMDRKEQRLKAETSRKNDLIAYLAHDLKTPLTSVIGYLSLLDEASDMPSEQRAKYTRITLDKAYRLEKMINEFFDITRYNLQQIVIQKEPIDLYYMLVQLTDEFLPVLEQNGNTAVLKADESLTVPGDPDKLARVFQNVLKNAAAYSYPHTEIVIDAWEAESSVVVRFTNRGKTIPQSKLDSIFEKFFRLDEARASGTGGAGLGLAIAREIVTLHGGSITAESRDDTVAFTVTLPAGKKISTQR